MKQVNGTALLLTIAEDLSREPVLRLWALDKTEKKSGVPKCVSSLEIHNGRKQFPVGNFCRFLTRPKALIDPDISLRVSGESIAVGCWICQRISDSSPRRFDQ